MKNMSMKIKKILLAMVRGGISILCVLSLVQASAFAQRGSGRDMAPQVVVKPILSRIINDRLTAIGTSQARSSVALTPWSNGKLEHLFVKAGDRVKAGQPIAALDSDNEQIMVERARVELENVTQTLDRLTRLASSDTASRVQVIDAELALARAKLALRDSELALQRRTLTAPIDGVVGILAVDAGNYVTTNTILARLDNRDKILIDVWLPERFAAQIASGQAITARAIARGGEVFNGHIIAIDNALDEASRTLRVRAEIVNEGDRLRAGMSFAVTFAFTGERFASVDPLAIQWRSEGAYVWLVDDESRVSRVSVAIIQRGSDYVLLSGEVDEGQLVVVQGVHNLSERAKVEIKRLSEPGGEEIEAETVSSIDPSPMSQP